MPARSRPTPSWRRPKRDRRRACAGATPAIAPGLPLDRRPVRADAAAARQGRAGAAGLTPQALAAARLEAARRPPRSTARKYETVRTLDRLNAWIARAHDTGVVALDTETDGVDPMQARAVRLLARGRAERGLLRAARPSQGRHGGGDDLFARRQALRRTRSPKRDALAALKPLLEDPSVLKIGQDLKYRLAGLRAARHRDAAATTTPC